MTGRESTEPLDPAQIMAVHGGGKFLPQADSYVCNNATCGQLWPCLPYRLAEALAAEQQISADVRFWARSMSNQSQDNTVSATCRSAGNAVLDILDNPRRPALAGDTEGAEQ